MKLCAIVNIILHFFINSMKEKFIQPTLLVSPQTPVKNILPYFDFSKYFWAFKLKQTNKQNIFIIPCSNSNKNCPEKGPDAAGENLTFSQDLIQSQ